MHPKKTFTDEEVEQIKFKYQSGDALWKIGEEFGVSRVVITRVVQELGIHKANRKNMKIEEHKKRIEKFGKVELVGDWIDAQTKTLYFCLEHKETHSAYPGNVSKGFGLACCLREGARKQNAERISKHRNSYDERIAEVSGGKIVRIGIYQGTKVPIEHHCRVHNETHLARPGNVLSGMGLICCRREVFEGLGDARNQKALGAYDDKLLDRSDGRFKRIDDYIDATTPVLHYCSVHDEEHLAIPNKLLNGGGMTCCNTGAGWDTLENLLENKSVNIDSDIKEPCQFYIFQVPNTNDCVKVGIAKSSLRRSRHSDSKDLYGDLVSVWQCSSRRNAILIETAVLRDPSFEHPTDFVDSLVFKAGQSEVRKVDIDALVGHVQDLFDSLEQQGDRWDTWALERVPSLRRWEQKVLRGLGA